MPHAQQIAGAQAELDRLLSPFVAPDPADRTVWDAPVRSTDAAFRNKAKMVVTGTANAPILGIQGQGGGDHRSGPDPLLGTADLSDCPLYPPGVEAILTQVRALIRRAQVPPYDVARRRGEIKNVLVTVAPDGTAMLRLVLRGDRALERIREHLPTLLAACPEVRVVTANLHPDHAATLEGDTEIHLAGAEAIDLPMGPVTLRARPRSFLQTNTEVAGHLYAQVGAWIDAIETERGARDTPLRVWDLYCGVGGFALTAARPVGAADPREVTGVEISEQAIVSARESAGRADLDARFHAADATAWAIEQARRTGPPDVVVVNPPRRGIGPELAAWIEASGVLDVVYSSCNPRTLATDLAAMPSLRIVRGRLVDMFPHTRHDEVVVRLRRTAADAPPTERSTP
ncbi:methyltransferase domain-containing protein [Brachybacterium sp. AOP25-B2-12]|uniref:methyltransferase domain-containing protein n=1 Tax=Brachybacterium sp. AOP25-B2-12 TaxID=3457710 RepID=UPI004034797B